MSINLDGAIEVAKMRAKKYTDERCRDPNFWHHIYNAHFDGLIECLGERESLRQILANRSDSKVPVVPADKLLNVAPLTGPIVLVEDFI